MKGNRLYKYEKLCSRTDVNKLFESGKATIAYPLRAVYRLSSPDESRKAGCRFLITIPKKKIRHAVDRVLLRRRVREAYRLNRQLLRSSCTRSQLCVDVAFIFLSDKIRTYSSIDEKMKTIISVIDEAVISHRANETQMP